MTDLAAEGDRLQRIRSLVETNALHSDSRNTVIPTVDLLWLTEALRERDATTYNHGCTECAAVVGIDPGRAAGLCVDHADALRARAETAEALLRESKTFPCGWPAWADARDRFLAQREEQ